VRASEETIMKSLEEAYRPERLITLQYSLDLYRHYQTQIAETGQENGNVHERTAGPRRHG